MGSTNKNNRMGISLCGFFIPCWLIIVILIIIALLAADQSKMVDLSMGTPEEVVKVGGNLIQQLGGGYLSPVENLLPSFSQ